MAASIALDFSSSIFMRIVSFFRRKEEISQDVSPAEIVTKEIDALWSIVRAQKEAENGLPDIKCHERIGESFRRLRSQFSDEQLEAAYTWPRFVKVAIYSGNVPVHELIEYVTENNYIPLTKRLSDLVKSVRKSEDAEVIKNAEHFSEAICLHILETINPTDVPSCLSLGRAAQKKGNYAKARNWFIKITETDEPFNGLTALLSCYEEETKAILSSSGKGYGANPKLREQVRELNNSQCSVYEKWSQILETRVSSEESSEQDKKEYVALLTGYARFERNRGNYDKAFELLERVPRTYPEVYRVYTEEAMLYQFRPYKNRYYSLEKAIEAFKKAYDSISESAANGAASPKSKKSILMPLANSYFQSGRYDEADDVCDSVLKIDSREQRAIILKNRIACLAS